MKIICIYIFSHFDPNVNTEEAVSRKQKMRASMLPLGISYIAAVLKKDGHEIKIIPVSDQTSITEFIIDIKESDLFCISFNYYNCTPIFEKLVKELKTIAPDTKILAGGSHVTLYPDEIMENKNIDAVCIGDGENAVIAYVNALKENKIDKKIDNLFIRQPDLSILKCEKSNFIENIDSLPFIDRHMWDNWIFDTTQHKVLIERGCLHRCSYCTNHRFADISQGQYLRYRKISSIISELEYIINEYPDTKSFMLYSENIASDSQYFLNLCAKLKEFKIKTGKKINYSVILNVTKKFVRKSEIFEAMKEANIKWVMFGFESASKQIRNKLNRPFYDNRDILKFCRKMQEKQIHTTIYVMYCYPYETSETYRQTVKWLTFFKPDAIGYSWMMLAKGSDLYNNFFVYKKENYNRPLFLRLLGKWRVNTFKLRVYITYKPFIETLFWFLKQFSAVSNTFLVWRLYNDLKNKRINAYITKAKQELDNGNFSEAIKYFNKIESLGDSWIFADRAFANLKLGKKQEALKDINAALKLEKDNKNYHNLKDEIIKYK